MTFEKRAECDNGRIFLALFCGRDIETQRGKISCSASLLNSKMEFKSSPFYSIVCNKLYGEKRMDLFICITDSLCCTLKTNTKLKVNYMPIKFKKIKIKKIL